VTPPAHRIIILDDHPLFREGLRLIIERDGGFSVVGEVADGATALALAEQSKPDLIVVDVHLPAEDGITVATQILAKFPGIKVVFLSADGNVALVRRALAVGGSGYLLKDSAVEDLIRALDAAVKGGVYLSPELASNLLRDYEQTKRLPASSTPEPLSVREIKLLRLIAIGLRNKDMADRLGLSPNSVATYRSRLLKRLGCNSTAELIRYAIQEGLVRA
jgi:DNA-binding NarL/FixJ family response regulator